MLFIFTHLFSITGLNEFIVLKPGNTLAHQDECRWNVNNSKTLIDLYDKYKDKVGSFKIKNLKQMWSIISEEMSLINKMKITPNNCENRWRVLERNYKKYIENKNGTGRGKKYFEFSEEMDQLFKHKKNVHPEILLSSEDIHEPINNDNDLYSCEVESPSTSKGETHNAIVSSKKEENKKNLRKKISTIEKIRQDRLNYQQNKLEIEKEKLQLLKTRNELIEARNEILKSQCCLKKNCCKSVTENIV